VQFDKCERCGGNEELAKSARWLFVFLLVAFLIAVVSALTAVLGAEQAGAACSLLSLVGSYPVFLVGCIRLYHRMGQALSAVAGRAVARAG
jgi:hypothetical protein